MRPEYRREDLGKGVRGKYYKAFTEGASFEECLKGKEPPKA